MHLERVKLKCIEASEPNSKKKNNYGFEFSKNQKSTSLYLNDYGIYMKLKAELKKRCILSTFAESYDIEKLIGKGSFGKVEHNT